MQMELSKIAVRLERISDDEAVLVPNPQLPHFDASSPLQFNAHDDHRIVMALAPLSMKIGSLLFDHPEVVIKSYPSYWRDTSFLSVCR
jgi:3-phosphoshikimate 1-carboxyvinyltransferase